MMKMAMLSDSELMMRTDRIFLAYTIFCAIWGALLYGDNFSVYSLYGAICFLLFCVCLDVYMIIYANVKYVNECGINGNCNDDGCSHDRRD